MMSSGLSSADEDEVPSSPNTRSAVPLSAISEQEDVGSASDSDASSIGGRGDAHDDHGAQASAAGGSGMARMPRAMEQLRLSRESTRLSESTLVKSGYLMKKGERRKAWQKRWFVLRGGQVAMYKSDKVCVTWLLFRSAGVDAC